MTRRLPLPRTSTGPAARHRRRAGFGRGRPFDDGHFRSVVEHSDDAILSQSLDGRVLSWNRAAERLFGWTARQMLGRSVTRLLPLGRRGEDAALVQQLRSGKALPPFETERLHRDGHPLDVSVTLSPIVDGHGHVTAAAHIVRDISARVQAQRSVWLQAHYDPLTQLPNRRLLLDELEAALQRAQSQQVEVALLFIDLDRFKTINDTLGHAAGDALLVEVASRICACARSVDTVARLNGDEFVVLLPDLRLPGEADALAQRINQRLGEPIQLRRDVVYVTCSIGYVVYPGDGRSASELFAHADLAMHESKRRGRNQTQRYDAALEVAGRRRSRLLTDLHGAIERQQLHLVYQPVFDAQDGRIVKCEALLRWTHPDFGPVSPAEFVPIAEESGAILAIGDWVFRHAMQQLAAWRPLSPDLQMAVNVSVLQLRAGDGRIEGWPALLSALDLPSLSVVAEITESVMVEGTASTEAALHALRAAGVQVAVDDFGIGFSCLASLDRLDVNCLKIDASFTRKLEPGARVVALCQAITAMAHALGLEVVVEGVETPQQLELVRSIGCDMVQGFLLSRPLRAEALEQLLQDAADVGDAAAAANAAHASALQTVTALR